MKACGAFGVTTRALTRKETNSSQERLCAAGAVLAKSRARRPAMRRGWVYVGAMEDLEETWFVVTGFMSHTGYSMSGVVCAACLETFLGLGRKKRSYLHHRHLHTIFGIENLGCGGAFPRSTDGRGKPIEGQVGDIPVLSEHPNDECCVLRRGRTAVGWRLAIYLLIVSALAAAITLLVVRIFGSRAASRPYPR